jgi:hypothetical protein
MNGDWVEWRIYLAGSFLVQQKLFDMEKSQIFYKTFSHSSTNPETLCSTEI